MESSRISGWSGKASIGVGGLWMLWTLAPWAGTVLILALLLALIALVALPLRQNSEIRILAWAGYLVSAISIVLALFGYGSVAFGASPSPLLFLLGLGNLCFGLLLTGFASLQGQALPRGRVLPIVLAVCLALQTGWGWIYVWNTPFPPTGIIVVWLILGLCFGSAWIALGLVLRHTNEHRR